MEGGTTMRWSWKIAKIAGTTLRVHVTFFLLLVWVAASSYPAGGVPAAVEGVLFVILVFACVVLHEFGHAMMARRFGIRTPDITLLPIGGLASLERMPDRPGQELLVALAGPAVNVVIIAVLYLVMGAQVSLSGVSQLTTGTTLIGGLVAVNMVLVLFNMIPAFPMDGGRVLRALLSMKLERSKATLYAARIGQAFAVVFAVIGLMGNPILLLIAVFLFFAAEAETGYETRRAEASRHTAREAMVTRFMSLPPDATAEDAGKLLLVTTQQEFPVVSRAGALVGMVTRAGLMQVMQGDGPETPVSAFMETGFPIVSENAPLETVLQALAASPAQVVGVRGADGAFVGYVSRENASELFMLQEARRRRRSR